MKQLFIICAIVLALTSCVEPQSVEDSTKNIQIKRALGLSGVDTLKYLDTVRGYDLYYIFEESSGGFLSYQFPVDEEQERIPVPRPSYNMEVLVAEYVSTPLNEDSITEVQIRLKELTNISHMIYEERDRLLDILKGE